MDLDPAYLLDAPSQQPPSNDAVNLPSHYARFPIEPIRFVADNNLNWFQGNIIKYILRWDAKDGVQDLAKAARYLSMWRKQLGGDKDWWRQGRDTEALLDDYRSKLAKVCAQNEELRAELKVIKEGGSKNVAGLRALRDLAERVAAAGEHPRRWTDGVYAGG